MAEYTLDVTIGSTIQPGTFNNVFITLMGSERESKRTQLPNFGENSESVLLAGKVQTFSVTTLFSLGCVLLLKVEQDPFHEFPEMKWFCSTIVVKTPEEDEILFPCHKWLSMGESVLLRGGRAKKAFEDIHPQLLLQRKNELVRQKLMYKWEKYAEGIPYNINIKNPNGLPQEIRYSFSKAFQFNFIRNISLLDFKLRGFLNTTEHWESFSAMKELYWFKKSALLDYVSDHWRDDDFFGYQFLNGMNPYMIQRCSKLPSNFAVTEEMVKPFLANGSSLTAEMKKGNIFISDYKIMEGLPTKVIDGKPVALVAALCLLYLNPEKKLLPIAIQLGQQPSEENLVFLPNDLESDWLLAKIFVRHAEFFYSEVVTHFAMTHLLAEVFTIATLRNLPEIHPLYKLLTPHHRHTLNSNILGRILLFGPGRSLERSSLESDGQIELCRRAFSMTTYASLCPHEDFAARGMESIPNFYFRDDALRLWNIINSFVKAVVGYYYPSDSEVAADSELQEWINEIFYFGFLGTVTSGIPSSFQTVEELIKFVTMVIYISSGHHAGVNGPQFDFQGWIPNSPILLHQGPPTTKGQSSMKTILATLTNKSTSILLVLSSWLLSWKYEDFVPLGTYPEQRFEETAVLQMIKDFQAALSSLSVAITERNMALELPYDYMNPKVIENSVTI